MLITDFPAFPELPSPPDLTSCPPSYHHLGISGSESDASSSFSIGSSYRRASSSPAPDPDSEPDSLDHLSPLAADIAAFLDPFSPKSTSESLCCHPVLPHEYWSLFDNEDFENLIEGVPHTYNSATLTLEVKSMTVAWHNSGFMWFSHGFQSMIKDGFIPAKDTLQAAGIFDPMVGLLQQAENKAFESFDASTPWKDSRRTADWALYRICASPADDKPLIAMEIGVSQRLKKSTSTKESLQDRAAAWLLSSHGITRAVVLIDLTQNTRTPDTVAVTVQVWRQGPPGVLRIDEDHTFTVARDAPRWCSADDVPADFPAGITFCAEDVGGPREGRTFVMSMLLLRNAVLATWELHLRTVEAGVLRKREMGKRRAELAVEGVGEGMV